MTILLDGKAVSEKVMQEIGEKAGKLDIPPGLATVLVGENPASKMYVGMKEKACEKIGFYSKRVTLAQDIGEDELVSEIQKLNTDDKIHGILVQFPLPKTINEQNILKAINPKKDVDGFSPKNMGDLMAGIENLVAATPKGVIMLCDAYGIKFEGQHAVVVNHSTVVGRPMSQLLLNRNATVTVAHQYTKDLPKITRQADILISATGVPHLIKEDMVSDGVKVLDVGICKKDGKLVGDVDYDAVFEKCSHISPVPGGAGPMTIAALLGNTLYAAEHQ